MLQSNRLNRKEKGDVVYLTFPNFDSISCIRHLFTTRHGGVSTGDLATMNLSFSRGDDEKNVIENYRRIADVLECEIDDFVGTVQTHTDNIKIVTKQDCGKGITKPCDYDNIDALITKEKGVVLVTYFADCVPLFFVDDKEKVIALAHSGYKGTLLKIGAKVVTSMVENFGCKVENIKVGIGPSICKNCYQVDKDVANQFNKVFENDKKSIVFEDFGKKDKYKIDLWKANEVLLKETGILPEHIVTTDICTCCNKDDLFSHRGSQGRRGNLAAFLILK